MVDSIEQLKKSLKSQSSSYDFIKKWEPPPIQMDCPRCGIDLKSLAHGAVCPRGDCLQK
jgi:hypothetical protein